MTMKYRSISMGYTRAFSFTDDSTAITGFNPTKQRMAVSNGNQLWIKDCDAAIHLNRLRQIQSTTYQRLFQSDRPRVEMTWPDMSSALQGMQTWFEQLPTKNATLPRKSFRSDLLHSSILILSPPLQGTLCNYGKFLIFEYCTEFADLMASSSGDDEDHAFLTYLDVLRTSMVGNRFVNTLVNDAGVLFSGAIPIAPTDSVPLTGPITMPKRSVGELVNKAHKSLDQFERIFEALRPRYGYSVGFKAGFNEFKAKAPSARQSLRGIYDSWIINLGVSRSQYVTSQSISQDRQAI